MNLFIIHFISPLLFWGRKLWCDIVEEKLGIDQKINFINPDQENFNNQQPIIHPKNKHQLDDGNHIDTITSLKRHQISPHAKEMMDENLNQLLHINQRSAELNSLIREEHFIKLKKNPWQINIVKTINDFQNRIFDNPEIKFRIGGRVIHSTSRLVNAKSISIIQRSQETQEEIQKDGEEPPLEENFETMDDLLGDYDDNAYFSSMDTSNEGVSEQIQNYIIERDTELNKNVYLKPFYNVDRTGQRFLSAPIRKVFRKIDFGDLGKALSQSLNRQLRRSSKSSKRKRIEIDPTTILPENILKKAEEDRAFVELQINSLFEQIISQFEEKKDPISFLSLIISPNPDGIVRTLLYLLQLVNRKKIDVWHQIDEDLSDEKNDEGNVRKNGENDENDDDKEYNSSKYMGSGLDIFVSPRKN
jgi:chromatin segregation and condensation protein Rec8/ScpA/Scc1 (kleisin family)